MLINTFWKILLKIIGLLLLFSCISIIPQIYTTLSVTNGTIDTESLLLVWTMIIITSFVYILFVRLFLFKTEWIIQKLKLESGFKEERIELSISTTNILSIAAIVIGGLMIADNLPNFCSGLFNFFQQKMLFRDYPDSQWLIYHFLKIIIGYLLLTNGKNLAKYIEKKTGSE